MTSPKPHIKVQVGLPPASAADNAALVKRITAIVNAAYAKDEEGIWDPSKEFLRTDDLEVAGFLRGGEILLAWRTQEESAGLIADNVTPEPSSVLACVRLHRQDERVYEVGLLASDVEYRGVGAGRDLMAFCEVLARDRGAKIMQVDLLWPRDWTHPFKVRLQAWYERLGYKLVRKGDIGTAYPRLVPLLAGPSDFRVFEKEL